MHRRTLRRTALAALAVAALACAGFGLLWLRLGSGPVNMDMVTPWMESAIGANFGSDYRVEVGGTQIERAGRVRVALRLRDVVVRDKDNVIVASAPKAEVRMSGASLLIGRIRAEGLYLVDAELSARISPDGRVTISAGQNARPLATTRISPTDSPVAEDGDATASPATTPTATGNGVEGLLAAVAWLDSLSQSGLDGHDLDELGFKSGHLVIDDQQNGKQWTFDNINLTLRKPRGGGVLLMLSEESPGKAWSFRALVGPPVDGVRGFDIVADKVRVDDILLALRLSDLSYTADLPVSGRLQGEIGRDGLPTFLAGKLVAEAGLVVDRKVPDYPAAIDRVEVSLDWEGGRRSLVAPFQIVSGANRITLLSVLQAPNGETPHWLLSVSGGTILLAEGAPEAPLILNRTDIRVRFDTTSRRIVLERGDISNGEIGVAGSGFLDYSGDEAWLNLGVAGTPMPVSALKLMWPATVAPEARDWTLKHLERGRLQRFDLAIKAPVKTLARGGPPVPDEGLSIDAVGSAIAVRPLPSLPAIREAEVRVKVTGRTVNVSAPQASVETGPGRKLTLADIVFEIPDTAQHPPPSRTRLRAEGPMAAAADLMAHESFRPFASAPIDPATVKGTVSAKVAIDLLLNKKVSMNDAVVSVAADISNFSADRVVMNQKLEAAVLKINAGRGGVDIKGDVKIAGQPASLDYRKPPEGDAEVRVAMTLDEAARARFGMDFGNALAGPVIVKMTGRLGSGADRDNRFAVDADLGYARVDNLLPGWVKALGKPGRVTMTVIQRPQAIRLDDLVMEGGGATIKGTVDLDDNGDLVSASFPTFQPSDADRASLKAERVGDGPLKVTMRGELFDGRGFIKSAMSGAERRSRSKLSSDLDIDIKIGTVAGNYGEALRGLDIKMTRRNGVVRTFSLSGKLSRDATLSGSMRPRGGGRDVVYIESSDAGALFRFTDIYPKVFGGSMWVAMDPPTLDNAPQGGLLNVRDFVVRGEGALDRVVGSGRGQGNAETGVAFSHLRAEFTRKAGIMAVREGVVRGPVIGATIEGNIDYTSDQIRMRGTFVPLYGLNNMFGRIPIVGIFLGGGSNEGLLGVTYEVVGSPGAPVLRVNPISAVAPGLLRKFFEFPGANGQGPVPPAPIRPP